MKTDVIFRVWLGTRNVLALFPGEPGTNDASTCSSYEHVGQHGSADPAHCMYRTRPAQGEESRPLLAELTSIGYDLNVVKRCTKGHRATRQAKIDRVKVA